MERLEGKLLIASPKLMDPNFYRSVLLMLRHDEEGSMGIILNRPTPARLRDVWSKVSDDPCLRDTPVHFGGPCEGPIMLLHVHEPAAQISVGKHVHFTADEDHIRWLVAHDGGPIKPFVGYAGWSPGQLDAELETGSWLLTPRGNRSIITGTPNWEKLIKRLTPNVIDVNIIPEDPSLN